MAGEQNVSFFKLSIYSPSTTHSDTQQDNPVNTVTRLPSERPRNRDSIPCNGKKFFSPWKCPDLLWAPQNLIFNGYPKRLRKQKIGHDVQLTTHFKSIDINVNIAVELGSVLHGERVTFVSTNKICIPVLKKNAFGVCEVVSFLYEIIQIFL